jgi:RNA polymerase sigma-70 factor, ECF subfamily
MHSVIFGSVCPALLNIYCVGSSRRRQLKPRQVATSSADKAVRLFTQGDARAFEVVYRSYFQFVRNICLRMLRDPIEAEDATQDVFVCVLCKINTFRGESAFSSWLYRLTTNSVLMRFRRNQRTCVPLEEPGEDDSASRDEIGAPDLNLSGLLDRIDLQSAIDVLPNGYKTTFLLHDVHGYAHREIAEMNGNSIGNSKSQLHKARLRLRKLLGDITQEVQKHHPIPTSAR